jgi:hypothetical protein
VKNIHIAPDADHRVLDDEAPADQDSAAHFTPGKFFKEAGTLIAVCLGLGLLMQILLA